MVASLALCLFSFSSVVDADAWVAVSAPVAATATTSHSSPSACLDQREVRQPLASNGLDQSSTASPQESPDGAYLCFQRHLVPAPEVAVPSLRGQVILVSRSQQWLWAYQDGQLVFATPVTTGRPELPTPLGTFHVMRKQADTTFYSPWPKGSPYYYAPLHIDYALLFRAGGFYIHDAPWRYAFGPGMNLTHPVPDGTTETGSHGCVNVPVSAGAWLYSWAGVGATIVIADSGPHPSAPSEHSGAV